MHPDIIINSIWQHKLDLPFEITILTLKSKTVIVHAKRKMKQVIAGEKCEVNFGLSEMSKSDLYEFYKPI